MSITDRLFLTHRQRETGTLSLAGESAFEQLSRELALDSKTLALVVGMTDVTLEGWQRGIQQPTSSSLELLDRVKRLHRRLYGRLQPNQVLEWLRTPNELLHYQVPVDVLIGGGLYRLEAALDLLEAPAT